MVVLVALWVGALVALTLFTHTARREGVLALTYAIGLSVIHLPGAAPSLRGAPLGAEQGIRLSLASRQRCLGCGSWWLR